MAEKGALMSKYGLYPVMVLVFIATFLSLIYGFASNGYLYETSIPNKPSGTAHHGEAADEHLGKTPAPSRTPEADSSTETPAIFATPGTSTPGAATPTTAIPAASATSSEATPASTSTPAIMATPGTATPADSPSPSASAPITAP